MMIKSSTWPLARIDLTGRLCWFVMEIRYTCIPVGGKCSSAPCLTNDIGQSRLVPRFPYVKHVDHHQGPKESFPQCGWSGEATSLYSRTLRTLYPDSLTHIPMYERILGT